MASRSEARELRYELKLVANESAAPQLCMALRLDPSAIRTLFPPRVVQSLYFDTPQQRALEENLAGISRRTKIRLRWYGEGCTDVQATLERKCRENSFGWKEALRLSRALTPRGAERRAFLAELLAAANPRWRAHLADLEPAQWVRYRREYFTSADRRVRLTLDRELSSFDQRLRARLGDDQPSPVPRVLVLELKCAPEHDLAAREVLSRLPIPLGRCSKFVLASEASSGPLVTDLGA